MAHASTTHRLFAPLLTLLVCVSAHLMVPHNADALTNITTLGVKTPLALALDTHATTTSIGWHALAYALAPGWWPVERAHDPLTLDGHWPMPYRKVWPTTIDGEPIVETPRLEQLWHTMEGGQDLWWLRQRYQLREEAIATLNPDLEQLDALDHGDSVLVWRREPGTVSQSHGSPNRGRLRFGEPLPPADKYVTLYQHRTFGTYYATSEIKRVFDAYALARPHADPVMVGDMSFRAGRRIKPHLSHRTGRDVDITYPRLDEAPSYKRFHPIRRRNLDAANTLWLVKSFVAGGAVEVIFMDYWVQRAVYREAVRQGAPEAWLEAVFQYPRWGGKRDAIVRRSRGHDDHMHIRFSCQSTDLRCR